MTKDSAPTANPTNDNDCAEPVLGADGWQPEPPVSVSLGNPVTDPYFYPKTCNAFGNGADSFASTVVYAGGSARRRDIACFFGRMNPNHVGEFVNAARPAGIPATVWSAFTQDLDSKLNDMRIKHDDRAIDAFLGNTAEDLMDCAPVAAAMLVIARVQNRCSLELATGGHHPLSPAKGDRAASARAENFIYEALTTVEWRA